MVDSKHTKHELSSSAPDEFKHRHHQIIQSLPFAVYTCDRQGYITEYNEAAAEIWGRKPEIGKDMWTGALNMYDTSGALLTPETCPIAIALREGRAVTGHEIILERPDGTLLSIECRPTPLFDATGNIVGAVNVLIDITQQKQSEERAATLASIVESSDDAIISKNLDGIITSWNHAAERIFGYTAEEMIGQSVITLIPAERENEEPKIIEQLKRGERVDHFETQRITKNGALIDLSLTISPLKDKEGNVIGASKIARDISEQKRSERLIRDSDERFRMAVQSTNLGTWEYMPKTGDLYWSDECRSVYGIPKNRTVSYDTFLEQMHPDDLAYAQRNVDQAMNPAGDGNYDIQVRIIRYSDQQTRWVRLQGKVFFDNNRIPEIFIGTILDITEAREATEQLERTVRKRTEELMEVNSKLGNSNQQLEQFAYVASHDLQEPLRKIKAFGDILVARYSQELQPDAKEIVNKMQSASERMKVLIEGLLTYSKLSRQDVMELVHMPQVVDEVLVDLDTSIKEKNAIIKVGDLLPVKGNPLQIRQLFQNLISNALKFSKPDMQPHITITSALVYGRDTDFELSALEKEQPFQLIEVADNGIGFEQQYVDKIFQVFQRLHGRSEYPGSGVGLSIVQKVVDNHHGHIKAEGVLGEGATFSILLPIA